MKKESKELLPNKKIKMTDESTVSSDGGTLTGKLFLVERFSNPIVSVVLTCQGLRLTNTKNSKVLSE